jgi:CheY-like chemotaxis protein
MSVAHLLSLLTDDVSRAPTIACVRDLKTVELEATQIVSARANVAGREPSEYMRTPLIVPRERRNVLIVDEDRSFANIIYRLLTPAYQVFIASDAGQALGQLAAGTHIDVILCGMTDPMAFHAQLSTAVPGLATTTLFLTSSAYDAQAHAFVEGLPNRRLGKPVEAAALRTLIAEQLATSRRAATSR